MRPAIVEVRKGILFWMYRADFTYGHWHDSEVGIHRPVLDIRREIVSVFPDYLIEEPEAKGMVWEDA